MKKVNSVKYVAFDGKEFLSKKDCEDYEKKEASKRFFAVWHTPDLTEGRGFQRKTVFCVEPYGWSGYSTFEAMKDYCIRKFGRKLAFVQGVSPTENWSLKEITRGQFEEAKHQFGTLTPTKCPKAYLVAGEKETGYIEKS